MLRRNETSGNSFSLNIKRPEIVERTRELVRVSKKENVNAVPVRRSKYILYFFNICLAHLVQVIVGAFGLRAKNY